MPVPPSLTTRRLLLTAHVPVPQSPPTQRTALCICAILSPTKSLRCSLVCLLCCSLPLIHPDTEVVASFRHADERKKRMDLFKKEFAGAATSALFHPFLACFRDIKHSARTV